MNDQEIKVNNDQSNTEISTENIAEPVIPAAVAAIADIVEENPIVSPKGKVTPGRRMRDSAQKGGHGANTGRGGRSGGRGGRGGEGRDRIKPEFDSKMIDIRRVTRVASGGRRYSFSVAVVAGDHKGRVGVGLGKGGDTSLAIEKATREAKKNLVKVPLSPQMVIPHSIEAKFGSARIKIFPARGRGIVAGSSARNVIELAGIKDICAKVMSGSKNKVNIARATVVALSKLAKTPKTFLFPGREAKAEAKAKVTP
jgi:small subunit ribosomal protein S5